MKKLVKLGLICLAGVMIIGCQMKGSNKMNGGDKKESTHQEMAQKEKDFSMELSREGRMAFEKMTPAQRAEVMKLADQGMAPEQALDRIQTQLKQKMNGNGKTMNGSKSQTTNGNGKK